MSRIRQVPVMDINQREKMLQQNQPLYHPPVAASPRPMQPNCRPRTKRPFVTKFRLNDTPALIHSGCNSIREFCTNIQNITLDLNHLAGSVESMVPLLNLYLATLQSRNIGIEQNLEPPIDVSAPNYMAREQRPEPPGQASQPAKPSTANLSAPRPEDIQQLLENPLVRNLLNGFMQNSVPPNADSAKGNTLHS